MNRTMSRDAPKRSGLCRFQIQRDRDGRHRWYLFNANGTMVGRHPDGFPTELETRRDAEQMREHIPAAPIIGEGGEDSPGADTVSRG
jgi:hypothetical protein